MNYDKLFKPIIAAWRGGKISIERFRFEWRQAQKALQVTEVQKQ